MADFASQVLGGGQQPEEQTNDFASAVVGAPQSKEPPQPDISNVERPDIPLKPVIQESMNQLLDKSLKDFEGQTIKLGQGLVRAKNGLVQTTLDVLETAGIFPEGSADQFTKMTNEERRIVEEQFKKEFGEGFQFAASEVTGELLPYLAIPAAGKGALSRLLFGIVTGGAAGGSVFNPEEDREQRLKEKGTSAAIGASVGGVASVGAEIVNKVKNIVNNTLASAIKQNRKFALRGLDLQKRTGIKFKLSQLTGDPAVESLEDLSRAGTKGERLARNIERNQSLDAFKFFKRQLSKIDDNTDDFGVRVTKTFNKLMGKAEDGTGLLGRRKANAVRNFKAAQEAGGTIPVNNTINKINGLIDEMDSPGAGRQSRFLAQELKNIRDDLLENGGSLKPLELQKRLEEWGRAAKGTGKFFSDKVDRANELRPARELFGALNDDLDDAIKAGLRGEGVSVVKSPFKSQPLSSRLAKDNNTTKLSNYSPTVFREVSPEDAINFLPGTPNQADLRTRLFFSNSLDLAKGQGKNKGVLLAFDASGIKGQVNRAKPAWEQSFNKGSAEFYTQDASQDALIKSLRGVRILKDAAASKPSKNRLDTLLKQLESKGWKKRTTKEYVEYLRPTDSKSSAEMLKLARDQYAADTIPITEAQESVLGKLFKTGNPTVEEIKEKFLKMDPSEINAVMNVLSKQDANIKRGLQRFWLQSFIDKAKSPGQGDALQFIPAKMLDLKKGDNRELYKAVFDDPKIRSRINDGIEAVSRIMINNASTGGRTVNRLRQVSELVTRNSSLADRATSIISDIFAPELVTKYVLDPRGVRALQELAKPTNQNRLAAATAVLVDIALSGREAPKAQQGQQPTAEGQQPLMQTPEAL